MIADLFNQHDVSTNNALVQECRDLFEQEGLSDKTAQKFQETIYHYYNLFKRPFSWREQITPYNIVVSEIMLQQTQTYRVAKKFDPFVFNFPTFEALAQAPFEEVLRYWKGLGYNRRALNLQKIAQIVVEQHNGKLPNDPEILVNFPGIGKATASSICAFAFNNPTPFIETNIRTVFIYFFFKLEAGIHDKDIMPLIAKTLDHDNAREWYYALMDYGVMLKKTVGNLCKLSKHHTKQSKFEGSDRQIRGMILQALLDHGQVTKNILIEKLGKEEARVQNMLNQLITEGFIILESPYLKLNS